MREKITETADKLGVEGARFEPSADLSRQAQDSFQPIQPIERQGSTAFLDLNSSSLYDSPVVLKAHISNVPQVSEPVKLEDVPQYLNWAFASGAQSVKPIKEWMAKPSAVTDAIISIGPALDNAVNYYGNTSADQVLRDIQFVFDAASDSLAQTFSYPHTPEERAKTAGAWMPLFFLESNIKESIHPKTAQQLGLETLKESELSELGILRITRKAGKGGDWPVINERLSPDVVQQTDKFSCSSACGEMLSNGQLKQSELITKLGAPCDAQALAKALGPEWKGKPLAEESLDELLAKGNAWGAELREVQTATRYRRLELAHTVVVDGLDEQGSIMIRDPADGTRYEMSRADFLKHWNGTAVYR